MIRQRVGAALQLSGMLLCTVLLASGCGMLGTGMPGGGAGRDAEAHFEDPQTQELAQAIAAGSPSRIQQAVEDGASVDAAGKDGVTLLEWAVYERQPSSLQTLLELGADVTRPGIGGGTVVHLAAIADHPRCLQVLLDAGVDPDLRHPVTERTPLIEATGLRTDEQFQMLLEAGAEVTLADRTGTTALHRAAMLNAGSQVLTLLEAGADPEAQSDDGATFQTFFWQSDADLMNDRALRERRQVAEWLQAHDVPLHEDARVTRSGR